MQYYWHMVIKYTGEIVRVRPDATVKNAFGAETSLIDHIQNLMTTDRDGVLTTSTRSIPVKEIADFRISDEVYTDRKLLESGSIAFGEPIYVDTKTIESRYVKKEVPRRRWDGYYRFLPAYRLIDENEAYVVMVFQLPIHQIDHQKVLELNEKDELRLARLIQ